MKPAPSAQRKPGWWASACWWGWLLCLLAYTFPTAAEVLTVKQARASITVRGVTTHRDVDLPYHWDHANPGQSGEAIFDFSFDLPQAPNDVWGIYFPRVGNAYQVWLNGTLVQRFGTLDVLSGGDQAVNGTDAARVPRYISVDGGHLLGTNVLRVHIRADVGRRGGLASPVVGPQDEVYPLYLQAYRWRATGSVGVMAFCLVVGLTSLALWTSHTGWRKAGRVGRDPFYLFAALAQLGWALYVGDALVEDPPLRWPWWGMVQSLALGVWGTSMVLSCMELADWREQAWVPRFRRWLVMLLVLCPGFSWWSLGGGQPLALTVWYGTFGLSVLGFVLAFFWSAVWQARFEQRLVAVVALINIVVALRDFYVFRIDPVYAANTWVRYSSVLFGLAMGYVVLSRFRATNAQLQDLLGNLAQRVSDKEQALRETYVRLESLARQQERTAERSRILRNMHDGVGSHISSALRQLQGGRDGQHGGVVDEVMLTLRDAMDQLKLSIDAIHLVPGDVTALLANLRYRLGPRFRAMGIDLRWDVDPLPLCPGLDAGAMNELQFMLFEALSNVLQHANARTLRIEAHVQPDARIFVRVVDDGCGFDIQSKGKRGMASLRERAAAIGAQLHIGSQSGETVVEIQLQV